MAHSPQLRLTLALVALAALLAAATQVQAHAHLMTADPAPNTTVDAGVKSVALHFSEGVVARFSGFELTEASGVRVATSPVAADPKDRKSLTADLKARLTPGTYKITWHAVAADTHRSQGAYGFKVH